jgi:3-oxocholest-4-en-26-oyl-CoA dehydrogenase beta subunit
MDLTLSGEQAALRDSAHSLLADKAPSQDISAILASEDGYDKALYATIASLGWTSLGLVDDEEAGLTELGIVLTQLGYFATPGPFLASMLAGISLGRLCGSSGEARERISRIISGEPATLITGHDLAAMNAHANSAVLSGLASGVEWATCAQQLVFVTESNDGAQIWSADIGQDGLRVFPQIAMDRTQCGAVIVEGLAVGAPLASVTHNLWRSHVHLLRLLRAADLLGVGQRALTMAIEHVTVREQFGRRIGEFQAVQHHLADTAIELDGAESLVYQALWRQSVGLPFDRHAAMAAWHTGDAVVRATQTANQVHGGIGFMREYHLHHFYHRALAQRSQMGPEQDRLRDLGDIVTEEASQDFNAAFAEWPAR